MYCTQHSHTYYFINSFSLLPNRPPSPISNHHFPDKSNNNSMSHIVAWRPYPLRSSPIGYWHHGILCPDQSVIHYTRKNASNFTIQRTSLAAFIRRSINNLPPTQTSVYTLRHKRSFPSTQIVHRAHSLLGRTRYNFVLNNCEHFAHWCMVGGPSISNQAALSGVAALVGTSGLALLLGTAAMGPVGGIVAAVTERYVTSFPQMHPGYIPLHCQYVFGVRAYPQPDSNEKHTETRTETEQRQIKTNNNSLQHGHQFSPNASDDLFFPQPAAVRTSVRSTLLLA